MEASNNNQITGNANRPQQHAEDTRGAGQHTQRFPMGPQREHVRRGQQPERVQGQQSEPVQTGQPPQRDHTGHASGQAQMPAPGGSQGQMGTQGTSSLWGSRAPQEGRPYTVALFHPGRPGAAVSLAAPPIYLPGGTYGASRMRADLNTNTVDWFYDPPEGRYRLPPSSQPPDPTRAPADDSLQRIRPGVESLSQGANQETVRTGPTTGATDSRVWDTDPEVAKAARERLQQDLIQRLSDVGRDIMRLARADAEPSPSQPSRNWEGQPTFERFVQYRLTQTIENARNWGEAWEYSNSATRRDEQESSSDEYESDPEGEDEDEDEDDDSDEDDPPSPPPPYNGGAPSRTLTNNSAEGSGVPTRHRGQSLDQSQTPPTGNANASAAASTGNASTPNVNSGIAEAESLLAENSESTNDNIDNSVSNLISFATTDSDSHRSQQVDDDQRSSMQGEARDDSNGNEPNIHRRIAISEPHSSELFSIILAIEVAVFAVALGMLMWNLV
ncbi:MAG: hypothetical protein M1831_001120 [Alyxoria varia]|nr:MAG: hypothetical protein M1831_001120 [Alyxoria varia]